MSSDGFLSQAKRNILSGCRSGTRAKRWKCKEVTLVAVRNTAPPTLNINVANLLRPRPRAPLLPRVSAINVLSVLLQLKPSKTSQASPLVFHHTLSSFCRTLLKYCNRKEDSTARTDLDLAETCRLATEACQHNPRWVELLNWEDRGEDLRSRGTWKWGIIPAAYSTGFEPGSKLLRCVFA